MNYWIISGNSEGEWIVSNGEKTITYERGVESYKRAELMADYANAKLMINSINDQRGIVPLMRPVDHTRPVYQSRI